MKLEDNKFKEEKEKGGGGSARNFFFSHCVIPHGTPCHTMWIQKSVCGLKRQVDKSMKK